MNTTLRVNAKTHELSLGLILRSDGRLRCGRASFIERLAIRDLASKSDLDAVVVREGKNLKGRVLGLVLGTIGKRMWTRAFENTVKAIEARNGAARKEAVS